GEVVTDFSAMVSRQELAFYTRPHLGNLQKFAPLEPAAPVKPALPSRYHRWIKGVVLDVYDFLGAYAVTCGACQHAIKKLLMPGQRGHKDRLKDLREARASIDRAIELEIERQAAAKPAANPITFRNTYAE
ncbi:hypothetical protein, partial [Chimaeribacter californicus]|uniref:hypothetical protein n=1 Tax=Chimaeribacter californicus TaxID=2060067 RepID=UPI0019D43BA3